MPGCRHLIDSMRTNFLWTIKKRCVASFVDNQSHQIHDILTIFFHAKFIINTISLYISRLMGFSKICQESMETLKFSRNSVYP